MAELFPHARFTRWIAAGLLACFLLLALRLGWPIYRRKLAIEKLEGMGTVISTDFWEDRTGRPRSAAWWKTAVPDSWLPAFENVVSIRIAHRGNNPFLFTRPRHERDNGSAARMRETLTTIRQFHELQWLDLDGAGLRDEDPLELNELKNLECLVLANNRLSGDGLHKLSKFSKLRQLDLSGTEIDDDALDFVGELESLELLRIDGTRITNAGIKHLVRLPKLRELSCSQTQVTEAGLNELLKTHPGLSVTDD